jgi:uncharacterized membrane protein YvlD (DUF360 family)
VDEAATGSGGGGILVAAVVEEELLLLLLLSAVALGIVEVLFDPLDDAAEAVFEVAVVVVDGFTRGLSLVEVEAGVAAGVVIGLDAIAKGGREASP